MKNINDHKRGVTAQSTFVFTSIFFMVCICVDSVL